MPWVLSSFIVDPGDETIKVSHNFYGLTKEEAKTYFHEHLESCEYFRAAYESDRTIEEWEEVDELPEPGDSQEEETEEEEP